MLLNDAISNHESVHLYYRMDWGDDNDVRRQGDCCVVW